MGDWLFSYDAVDRLTAASASLNAPAGFKVQTAAWSYDSYGNRTAQSFANGVSSVTVSYNSANNRINTVSGIVPSYVYDASGNTLFDGRNEYWYDAEGQLCAVASANAYGVPVAPITGYLYDAVGARIGKVALAAPPASSTSLCAPPSVAALNAPGVAASGVTVTARYLVDLGGDQVTELNMQNGTTTVPLGWAHSNIFSAARLTATYDTKGLHYELADPLGTKRIQANISGQLEMSWASLPFGDALTPYTPTNPLPTSNDATEHHFTGKERDTESGNDYFFARYYNSAIGRFTTPDWSAKVEPVPYAQMGNPQSFNLYTYVQNNPITLVDIDGHKALDCSGNNAAGVGCQYKAGWDALHGINSQFVKDWAAYFLNPAQDQNHADGFHADPNAPQVSGSNIHSLYFYPGHSSSVGTVYYGAEGSISGYDDFVQTITRLGPSSHGRGSFVDNQNASDGNPLYEPGSQKFRDTPTGYRGDTWTGVLWVGHADSSKHTFTAVGAVTYGFSLSSTGVYRYYAPSAPSRDQLRTSENTLRRDCSSWKFTF
jgi:RHS repeat-associated protein